MVTGWLREKLKNVSLYTYAAILLILIIIFKIVSIWKSSDTSTTSPVFRLEQEKVKLEKELEENKSKIAEKKRELDEIKKIQDPDERRKKLADYANRRWSS